MDSLLRPWRSVHDGNPGFESSGAHSLSDSQHRPQWQALLFLPSLIEANVDVRTLRCPEMQPGLPWSGLWKCPPTARLGYPLAGLPRRRRLRFT